MPVNFTVGINDNKKRYRKDLKPRGNVSRPGSTDRITSASVKRAAPSRLPADPSKDYLGDRIPRQLVKHMTATRYKQDKHLDPSHVPRLMKGKR